MEIKVSNVIETYKKLATIPSPASAIILPGLNENTLCVHSTWNTRDLVKSDLTKFSREYIAECTFAKFNILSSGVAHDTSSVCLNAFSKSGRKHAVIRKKGKPADDSVFLEVWNLNRKESTFDMSERKEHGKIYDNNLFGCLEWSADEKYLLYTAEMKQPKSESFLKNVFCRNIEDKLSEEITKGEEYVFCEDWGETLVGIHHPVLCILEVETGFINVLALEGKHADVSISQAIWGPNDESIVCVGIKEFPRRLGLQYCTNRRSSIYSVNIESKAVECISEDDRIHVRSPRFSPDFESLVFLQNKAGGPHHMCSKLMKCDWKTKQITTIVDIIEDPVEDDFTGIYTQSLPTRCFAGSGRYIFFSSPWRSYQALIGVDLESRRVQRVNIGEDFGECSVLDIKKHFIVASVSSPNVEPCLVIGHINFGDTITVTWEYMDINTPVKIPEINWAVHKLSPPQINVTYSNLKYEIIVLTPTERKDKAPLIVWPHGGPHSVMPAAFQLYATAFVKLGYLVCMVNYRGSSGFGENNIKSLLGNVGCQDVSDVQYAAEYLKNQADLNIGDVVIFGGSHGGFLAAHLSGQFPDFYKAAICRNPVIDISGMVEVSDIPDWCWTETGHGDEYDFSAITEPALLKCMWEKSPVRYIKSVSVPTLLLLGKKDLRVPSSQGLKYYHILKSRNVPVSIYYYDDNHALSKTEVEGDCFMQIVLWLKKHLNL